MDKNQLKTKTVKQVLYEYQNTWAWYLKPGEYTIKESLSIPTSALGTQGSSVLNDMFNACPGLLEKVKSPVSDELEEIHCIIVELNDFHGWSRQQVADWLETLDVKLEIKEQ